MSKPIMIAICSLTPQSDGLKWSQSQCVDCLIELYVSELSVAAAKEQQRDLITLCMECAMPILEEKWHRVQVNME